MAILYGISGGWRTQEACVSFGAGKKIGKIGARVEWRVAIAIVDDVGNLISYARMDRCRAIPQRMAVRKAYTAALSGQDTLAYAERLKSQGRTVAEMGDPNLAAVQGGLVILHTETGGIMGGIGVSGLTAQEDEDIARLGLRALGL